PDSVRFSPRLLGSLPIFSPTTQSTVPLASLATFTPGEARGELRRENQQQLIVMTADLSDRSLGAVMGDVRKVLADNPPPAGVRVELGGENESCAIVMTAALRDRSLGAVMGDVRKVLADNPPPAGVRVELGGQYA